MNDHSVIFVEDDGLPIPHVQPWAKDKYRLVGLYDKLFATGMKSKWDVRVYIDLYVGAGFSQIEGTSQPVYRSPLIALGIENPFDKYIFCESNPTCMEALQERVKRLFPNADIEFVTGDCNETTGDILSPIPKYSKSQTVLSFCFVDPYDISIRFSTILNLASLRMDFLILLALHMDANRNENYYTNATNQKVENFLGTSNWRNRWQKEKLKGVSFANFLAEEYSQQMGRLGYLYQPIHNMKKIRTNQNLPLYHLAFYSKHETGYKFWKSVLKYSTDQPDLLD